MQNVNLIVLGHGSKSQTAIDDFNFIVESVKSKAQFKHVLGAHMELAAPSLQSVVENLYEKGERNFVVFPYFLFNGMHIRKDIPEIIDEIKRKYSDISINFLSPIGREELMADIIIKKINQIA